MTQMGTYAELLSTSVSFSKLLEDINQHKQEHEQQSGILTRQVTRAGSMIGENEDDEEITSFPTNIETKKEGAVKWHVYISYLRAGIGVVLGFILILSALTAHQVVYMYSNRWLADWSDDESHRFNNVSNCTYKPNEKIQRIRLMNETEWNAHRAHRFNWFSSKFISYFDLLL
jgi:hypothetical protein